MGLGKYSPTVSYSYAQDQKWFDRVADPVTYLDPDGYDSYGYSGEMGDGPDRAGYTEMDYLRSGRYDEDGNREPGIYGSVDRDWWGKMITFEPKA